VTDPEALARYYDLDLRDDPGDTDLYLALAARTGGPVLELAAGSGRIAVPIAAAGYDVTGIDNDPAMLARAELAWKRALDERVDGSTGEPTSPRPSARTSRSRGRRPSRSAGTLELIEADLTAVRLRRRFGLAILALNTLLLLERPERQLAALRTLAAHLRRDGLAVVDIWLPAPEDLVIYDGRILLEWIRDDPETGEQVAKLASARFDAATATVVLSQLFDASARDGGGVRRTARSDRLRLLGVQELIRLAGDAGLAVAELAGDYRMGAFGPGEERVILVGRLV
jgi:SAM-dependent methyltransferase